MHLAQLNVGRTRGAIDEPVMAGFRAELDRINALASAAQASSGGIRTRPATP